MAKSGKEFLQQLVELSNSLRQKIEADVSGFASDAASSAERRMRAQDDFEFFARTYFPHYVKKENSRLHDYLYPRLQEIPDSIETDAVAAPRGEAKSTITTQIWPIWLFASGRKHYGIIGMDAFDQAATMLEAIKAELEFNPRLAMDFPEICGQGRVWRAEVILTANNRKLEAVGSGKRIRGRRHGPYRPDFFVGDDLENDDNVHSPLQRDKSESWINKAVLKLGEAGGKLDVVIIGTILHYDSMLARLIKNPLWRGKKFRALITWPSRMDLWDRWEELLLNVGKNAAAEFYQGHAPAMNEGAEVSWPTARPLVELMKIRARDGHAAFDSELQNDPLSDDAAPFAKCVTFWVNRLAEWRLYGACDPSLGKHGASRDPSALLVGGFNRETGILDVVEAAIRKRLPDRIIEDVISLQIEYRCLLWVVESVQFQEFLRTELVKRSAVRGIPVPARAVTPSTDKLLRIESLQPHMVNGLIRLHPSQHTLIEQLRHFPKADHDDGPDALQMLWMAATTGFASSEFKSSGPRVAAAGGMAGFM
jgi:predicted phage terminase large subunit-like protein